MSKNLSSERVGTVGFNHYGSKMEVIQYDNYDSILVKFEKGKPVHTHWDAFKRGGVRSVYDLSVYGIGYLGEGEYKTSENNKQTKRYCTWQGMIERCYSEKHLERFPSYSGCTVVEEWHNFQTFSKWYEENYYEIEGEKMCLDKDVLFKGNKIYSPKTCIFVPDRINTLFVNKVASRGNLPIGVHLSPNIKKKYYVKCSDGNGGDANLGYFRTIEEAFMVYKEHKEQLIKQFANDYKDKIPDQLYQAMLRYKIEITD